VLGILVLGKFQTYFHRSSVGRMPIALNYSLRTSKPELYTQKLGTAGRRHSSTLMVSHLWFQLKLKTDDEADRTAFCLSLFVTCLVFADLELARKTWSLVRSADWCG
jgi:hypothetical protein